MKCDNCGMIFHNRSRFVLDEPDLHEEYCSAECAMRSNGIKCASEMLCSECGAVIIGMPYIDISSDSGDLYCSAACALAAKHITFNGATK